MIGYVPAGFNPEEYKWPDKIIYIMTLLYYGRILNKNDSEDSFIPLSSVILHYILNDYRVHLQFLIDNGIIETNNHYVVGHTSKGYRFTAKYSEMIFRKVTISNKRMISKIKEHKMNQVKQRTAIQYVHIWNCLNRVKIKSNKAKEFLINSNLKTSKYIRNLIAVEMIENGIFFQVVDNTAGRVHNNITNMSKMLRPFLRHENSRLIEIDIANSQPFLFNILINSYMKDHRESITDIYNNLSYVTDLEIYKNLTSKGEFYEYLMSELAITEQREAFKIRFYKKVFYCAENPSYVSTERNQFRQLFPTVSKIISYYKKDDFRQLAIKLQKAEADIMINTIVPVLAEKDIFLLTIHDSILTTKDNAGIVKETILAEFKRKFNLIPTLKIKGA